MRKMCCYMKSIPYAGKTVIVLKKKKKTLSKNEQIWNLGKKVRDQCAMKSFCSSLPDCNPPEMISTDDHDYAIAPVEIKIRTEENTGFAENLTSPTQLPTSASINSYSTESSPNIISGLSQKRVNRKEPLRKNALAYLTDKQEKGKDKNGGIRVGEKKGSYHGRKDRIREKKAAVR